LGTDGSSWIERPMPWPLRSRSTEKPWRRTSVSTARPMSLTRLPARAAFIAWKNAAWAQAASSRDFRGAGGTTTVMAASAM
jgi:hypothetical protein